jgi:hypothetical protein
MMGRIDGEIRPPLYPLGGVSRDKVRAVLVSLGLVSA